MSDDSRGWLADVRYDARAGLFTATVRELSQVQATASTRQQALAELQLRIAKEVGVKPQPAEDVN